MRVQYFPWTARAPIPSLGNTNVRPRPLLAVRLTGPTATRVYTGFLDTGADDTVFDEASATILGIDLSQAPSRDLNLVGRTQALTCRYAPVELGISDGIESFVWTAVVGFVPISMHYSLLGFAGFLQFFDVTFRGADREVNLASNREFQDTSF